MFVILPLLGPMGPLTRELQALASAFLFGVSGGSGRGRDPVDGSSLVGWLAERCKYVKIVRGFGGRITRRMWYACYRCKATLPSTRYP